MDDLKYLINTLNADPYQILNSNPNTDPSTLRKNYYLLAIKYHPDKNQQQSAKLMFYKVNLAYEYLQIQANRKIYQSYAKAIEEQRKRDNEIDVKRKILIDNLKKRQQQYTNTKNEIQKLLKKQKQFFNRKIQQQQQRQNIKKQIFENIGVPKYYQLICSFDIFWEKGLSFTQKMLNIAFNHYGKVSHISLESKRNRATITFDSIQACTQVVKQFQHPLISISYHLQPQKRQHLLKALKKQQIGKIDLSLTSQNIERFKQLINRGSGIYQIHQQEQN